MASSDSITSFETWAFRPTFDNSWISETFSTHTDTLTKALTQSLRNGSNIETVSFSETPLSSLPRHHTVSSSGGSGPEPEPEPEPEMSPVSKRPKLNPGTKKNSKRKTRKSKRSPTTFIIADPDNFRQMVQQVTGVRFISGSGPILKPEPHRVGFGPDHVGCHLPTLDTSAFLLDHHHQVVGPGNVGSGPQGFGLTVGSTSGPGFDFDGLSCFPTLESWKVK